MIRLVSSLTIVHMSRIVVRNSALLSVWIRGNASLPKKDSERPIIVGRALSCAVFLAAANGPSWKVGAAAICISEMVEGEIGCVSRSGVAVDIDLFVRCVRAYLACVRRSV